MKNLRKAIAIGAVLAVMLPPIGAEAHVRKARTSLTLRVTDRTVDRGDTVVLVATLKSPWVKCIRNKKIKLYKGSQKVAVRRTTSNGTVVFRRQVFNTTTFRAKFAGRRWGTHPHRHVCKPSTSGAVRIRVS